MAEPELKVTYETIFELLHREKSRDELQKLDAEFYQHLAEYLKEKRQPVLETDPEATAKSRILLDNVQRIITELYNRREKKILELAIIKSRTKQSSISIQNLLESEKAFFNAVVLLLDQYRQNVLYSVLRLAKPTVTTAASFTSANASEIIGNSTPDVNNVVLSIKDTLSTAANHTQTQQSGLKKVLFLESIPRLIGEELEPYGPFKAGDKAELPIRMAELLIAKEQAQEI